VGQAVDQIAFLGVVGWNSGVVFGGEWGEGIGGFAADDVGLGVNAGFQGVHAGGLLAGVGAGAGGFGFGEGLRTRT
jgi:hypothetical protein